MGSTGVMGRKEAPDYKCIINNKNNLKREKCNFILKTPIISNLTKFLASNIHNLGRDHIQGDKQFKIHDYNEMHNPKLFFLNEKKMSPLQANPRQKFRNSSVFKAMDSFLVI